MGNGPIYLFDDTIKAEGIIKSLGFSEIYRGVGKYFIRASSHIYTANLIREEFGKFLPIVGEEYFFSGEIKIKKGRKTLKGKIFKGSAKHPFDIFPDLNERFTELIFGNSNSEMKRRARIERILEGYEVQRLISPKSF